ncbi:serine hydrolase domain-containing protein [Hwangdonia lutea]|uniref:Serine hydrolase domain-containing protein n=1 Tax=Hwangdonia lutea TaxID=3075823 RepID=A0AA97EL36_9FLAO|nr:serine hydrolase domain-containing protein [Hwangdonia sp. SCSIO 19198]WOD43212.1 serine hydrolase domain-containing protein [Hwangdonia sp. SCSIO 19198]
MRTTLLSLTLFIGLSCFGQQNIDNEVTKLFKTELEKENIKSGILHVYSKSKGIDIQLAKSTENAIKTNSPFYTASITKMLTATAIGVLKDENKLRFEDKISKYLPESLMANLHVLDGKDYSRNITIKNLLQHTSGLPDYFTDKTIDESPNVINQLLVDTNKTWSAVELVDFAKHKMNPHFIPGTNYHYTDTAYVLLALIIEKVSGLSLEQFFQRHIFQPLKMHSSYINLKSSAIEHTLPMAKFYVGDIELSSIKSLSADWGGGGLVSTTQDLINFFEAFNSDLIINKTTRIAMQNWVHETKGMAYGFGIRQVSIKDLTNNNTGLQLIGHSGSTASFLWYCEQLDTYISGTLNQLEASKSALILVVEILKIIERKD